jgi:Holliday junction resolvasome RuvABC endonuclease subunit
MLALDVSSVCVGWALFSEGVPEQFGKYHTVGDTHDERLLHFHRWLGEQLQALHPDELVLEEPYFSRQPHTFAVLTQYCTMVLLAHMEYFGRPMPLGNRIQPAQVKRELNAKYGTSHTNRKRLMVLLMNQTYGLDLRFKHPDKLKRVSDDDIADALALGRAWLQRAREEHAAGTRTSARATAPRTRRRKAVARESVGGG